MITAETLQQFIEENDTDAVIQALASMSESERLSLQNASLEAMANIWYQASLVMRSIVEDQKDKYVTHSEQRKQAHLAYSNTNAMQLVESAQAAVLYCCDFPTLKSAGFKGLPSASNCSRILGHRKPKWLKQWCSYVMDIVPGFQWKAIVELEKAGLVTMKHDSEYYQALAFGLTTEPEMEAFIETLPSLKQEFLAFFASPKTIRAMATPVTLSFEVARKQFRKQQAFKDTVPANAEFGINDKMLYSQYVANTPRRPEEHPKRWIPCLCNLTTVGIVDRNALIDITFQLLANVAEEQEKRVTGFELEESVSTFLCLLNDSLCPNKAEYLFKFIPLLGAVNKNVSEYALKALLNLPDELLPVAEICNVLPLTFRAREKEPAALALTLLVKMLEFPEVSSRNRASKELNTNKTLIALTLIDAFSHKSKAIHKDAIKLLTAHDLTYDQSVAAKLSQSLDLVEGTNRIQASELLNKAKIKTHASKTVGQPLSGVEQFAEKQATMPQLQLIAPEGQHGAYQTLAGIPKLAAASTTTSPQTFVEAILSPVDLVSMEIPKLYEPEQTQPITSVDDLIFLASACMKSTQTTEKAELLLDGIARLWNTRPADFVQKIETINATMRGPTGAWWDTGQSPLGIVCQIWLQGINAVKIRFRLHPTLFSARCIGLASRICAGLILPMLAAPTHKGCWIEPVILVRRIDAYQKQGRLLDTAGNKSAWSDPHTFLDWLARPTSNAFQADAPEFIQALLRLAPDGRDAALKEAFGIDGDFGRALRYALGDGDLESIETPELALAAFRSRYPRGTCLPLAKWIKTNWPDAIYPAVYWSAPWSLEKAIDPSFGRRQPGFLQGRVPEGLAPAADASDPRMANTEYVTTNDFALELLFYPTVQLHKYIGVQYLHDELSTRWLQNTEPFLARMARGVLESIESTGGFQFDNFNVLFNRDIPLYENGTWILALSLTAKCDDLRRLALDILIAAVEENRVDARAFGQAMASLKWFSNLRWTKALRELARVSALHALFCWQVLDSYISNKKQESAIGHLELLLEIKEEFGFGLSNESILALGLIQGTGKAAKIAKSLTAGAAEWSNIGPLQEAAQQSLRSRSARVERWQQSQYFNTTTAVKQ